MEAQAFPLTPLMREALAGDQAAQRRQIPWVAGAVFAVFLIPLPFVLAGGEAPPGLVAFFVAGLLATVGGALLWWRWAGAAREALGDGTYTRYTGPIDVTVVRPGGRHDLAYYSLRLRDARLTLPSRTLDEPTRLALDRLRRGGALHSTAGGMLFALWDQAGELVYQHPAYDLRGDAGAATAGLHLPPRRVLFTDR